MTRFRSAYAADLGRPADDAGAAAVLPSADEGATTVASSRIAASSFSSSPSSLLRSPAPVGEGAATGGLSSSLLGAPRVRTKSSTSDDGGLEEGERPGASPASSAGATWSAGSRGRCLLCVWAACVLWIDR